MNAHLSVFPAEAESCKLREPIDGTELVETFLNVRRETGKKIWDAMDTEEFRAVFVCMLTEAREGGGA